MLICTGTCIYMTLYMCSDALSCCSLELAFLPSHISSTCIVLYSIIMVKLSGRQVSCTVLPYNAEHYGSKSHLGS